MSLTPKFSSLHQPCKKRGKNDSIAKKFYNGFKKRFYHQFKNLIKGMKNAVNEDDWEKYISLLLCRLMFVYFLQKKGLFHNDPQYLQNRLKFIQNTKGKDKFYHGILRKLFHDYCFEIPEIEKRNKNTNIADGAFEKLFEFFEGFEWTLDTKDAGSGKKINPDVLGYVFEKFVNQKEKGAYYTKEDVTEYISRNTIIPFLFDKSGIKENSAVWDLLKIKPDRYIYPAVKYGVGLTLPKEIAAGMKDVTKRTAWNQPADAGFGLPTESWREHIARRERCLDLQKRLKTGNLRSVNDLITYNFDIRQFVQDVLVNTNDPVFLWSFYSALNEMTILDPTCGSGEFLLAAMDILEPLYHGCLDRMRFFMEENERQNNRDAGKFRTEFDCFRNMLHKIDDIDDTKQTNQRYFVDKNIITNNLYGVDLMPEAVEIGKLRLFLKLIDDADSIDSVGTLSGICFNLKSGNTLVGYISHQICRDHPANKLEVDKVLAEEYKIEKKGKAFSTWRSSHQPFHWFMEFRHIMKRCGFDVIIGNPPYIEYSGTKIPYTMNGYETKSCGNLYAQVVERSFLLLNQRGRMGIIIPHSAICTERMKPLINLLCKKGYWLSSFDIRPSKLFDGVDQRLLIYLADSNTSNMFTSGYHRWNAEYREFLFPCMEYVSNGETNVPNSIAKVSRSIEKSILAKIFTNILLSQQQSYSPSPSVIYYHNAPRYFIRVMPKPPSFWNEREGEKISSHVKEISFANQKKASVTAAALNSSLFYWWFILFSNCRDLTKREIDHFPLSLDSLSAPHTARLGQLFAELNTDFEKHKQSKETHYQATGKVIYDEHYPKKSKSIIDKIDTILAEHYGFSAEELDYIINYDIKYRMGESE